MAAAGIALVGIIGYTEEPPPAPYPLDTCIVSGKKLGEMGEPVTHIHEGREIKFCCKACPPKFDADTAGFLKKLDDAIIVQQTPIYPTDICVVDGQKLGSMGEPVNAVVDNRLVRLSCKACLKNLHTDHAKAVAKLDEFVIGREKPHYPLETCVVTGKKLGEQGDPVDYVFAGQLFRFCCKDCIAPFLKDSGKYIEKLNDAHKVHQKGK
ncbi:hypothetical protein HYR69_10805 [Candidatus Sumerlaeota bacterium]|nr:hypothetical protein [Candidatus Sumerlaeota bacterium]